MKSKLTDAKQRWHDKYSDEKASPVQAKPMTSMLETSYQARLKSNSDGKVQQKASNEPILVAGFSKMSE